MCGRHISTPPPLSDPAPVVEENTSNTAVDVYNSSINQTNEYPHSLLPRLLTGVVLRYPAGIIPGDFLFAVAKFFEHTAKFDGAEKVLLANGREWNV